VNDVVEPDPHLEHRLMDYVRDLDSYKFDMDVYRKRLAEYEVDAAAYEAWCEEQELQRAREVIARHEAKQ
jgi:hypothetical protein